MSLEHSPIRRTGDQSVRSERSKRMRHALDAPLSMTSLHDDQVLTFFEWCQINRISERTGRRIIKRPDGPVVTKLSAKRIGVTVGNNKKWQARRASKEIA
jgi:hypothetical protein